MKISCPSCSAKYSIADEKVQNRLAKIRCRKCGTSIVIDGNVSPANVYAADGAGSVAGASAPAAAPAADVGTTYSVDLGENDQRQMGVPEIVAAYNAGTVTAETFVWADGFADWTALAQVEELVAALHAAAQQDSPTALTDETSAASASTAPDESPWDHHPAAGASGGGADLFGNVASAGGLEEHSPAAVPAADPSPFGGGGGLADATGARNESSVLFSLSALTSSASTSRPSVPAPAASYGGNNDDSGLIDLKALTAAAEATAHAPNAIAARPVQTPLAAAPLGGSPLGASPLGAGLGIPSIPPQAAKGNNNVLIIGGFLFAGIVAAAAIMTLGGKDEEPAVAPPAPALAPAPAPAPAALPTAQTDELPTADAKPPSTGTEEEESAPKGTAKPTAKPRPKPSGRSSGSSSPAPAASPSPSPAPAPKPASSVGKCGCKKDDLMCLMNCAQ